MDTVIVTIKLTGSSEMKDFEIPSTMTAEGIISQMQEPFLLNKAKLLTYKLRAERLRRVLNTDETLEQAGVWDGELLTIFQ